ncbi:MAG: hypothetical protein Q8N30_12370 [Methylococcales bacterium]|nr:hypothetical protein [Methylococcales bacterium]
MKKLLLLFCLLTLVNCAELPPKNADNVCAIFKEKEQWYDDAKQAEQRWGVPVAVLMAIMHQESHFVADAKPPRTWLLGFIPWFRPSSAYGYAQALDGTWDNYLDAAGSFGADRDDFADAVDFIGWYNYNSHTKLGIPTQDAKLLYFAYYEGIEGYNSKNHFKKTDLQKTADKVAYRAKLFQTQLSHCQMN